MELSAEHHYYRVRWPASRVELHWQWRPWQFLIGIGVTRRRVALELGPGVLALQWGPKRRLSFLYAEEGP